MGVLEPEWVIPISESALDGMVSGDEVIILTESAILFYEKKSRRKVRSVSVEFGTACALGIVEHAECMIVARRCGAIRSVQTVDGSTSAENSMVSDPGFCKPILFSGLYVAGLADSSATKTLQLFDPPSLDTVAFAEVENREELGIPLDLCACNSRLYCGFESGDIYIFNSNFTVERRLDVFRSPTEPLVSLSAAGDYIYALNANSILAKIGTEENTIRKTITIKDCRISQCSIRADGKLLCIGTTDGQIILLSTKSLKILSVLDCHSSTINRIYWDAHFHFYTFSTDCLIACYKPYAH